MYVGGCGCAYTYVFLGELGSDMITTRHISLGMRVCECCERKSVETSLGL